MPKPFRIAVLASGGGSNLQSIIDAVNDNSIQNAEVALVISDKKGAYALERAKNHGIKAVEIVKKQYSDKSEFCQKIHEQVNQEQIDLVVLAGFLSILSEQMVNQYEKRIINIHPSLIPQFCGMGFYGNRVHKAVIESGVKQTGATVHYVEVGVDTGPIILQQAIPVLENDTVESVAARVLEVEHKVLVQAIKQVLSGLQSNQ